MPKAYSINERREVDHEHEHEDEHKHEDKEGSNTLLELESQKLLNERLMHRCAYMQNTVNETEEQVQRLEAEFRELSAREKNTAAAAAAAAVAVTNAAAAAKKGANSDGESLEHLLSEAPGFLALPTLDESTEAGVACFVRSEHAEARLHFFQARHLTRKAGDSLGEARAEANLCNVYSSIGEPRLAFTHFERAISLFRKCQRSDLERAILSNGIICCLQLRRFDEGLGLALRKLAVSHDEPEHRKDAEMWIDKINREFLSAQE